MDNNKKFLIKVRAIILHEGRLLVVRHPHDTSYAALPGGHLEWGEDIKECLSREIIEELGINPEIGRLLYINNFLLPDGKQHIEFFFEVKNGIDYIDSKKLIRSHSHEIFEMIWVSPADNVEILPRGFGDDFKAGKVISDEVRYIKIR